MKNNLGLEVHIGHRYTFEYLHENHDYIVFIGEVQRYGYITVLKVVQNITSQYNVGDTINEYNMLEYEYLNGQYKPIL